MIFTEQKQHYILLRDCILDIQLVCLRQYKRTSDKKYLDYAKYFGNESQQLSQKIC